MKHLITLALLLAAVGFYVIGMSTGTIVCIGLGGILELGFWFRLFRSGSGSPTS